MSDVSNTNKRSVISVYVLPIAAITAFLLLNVNDSYAFSTKVIEDAIKELCGLIEGHLGGLLVTVAAFGAIVAAAMGSYRAFYSAIITAVGAFAVSSILSLYFEEAAANCGNGGKSASKSAEVLSTSALTPTVSSKQSEPASTSKNDKVSSAEDEENEETDFDFVADEF